jgi:transposase
MWLLACFQPDFKTIAAFRKDLSIGIKNTFCQFVQLCSEINIFTNAIVAIDGSKLKKIKEVVVNLRVFLPICEISRGVKN